MTTPKNPIADALREMLSSPNVSDSNLEPANLVDTTDRMASALFAVARAITLLGNADASTPFGAIEAFGMVVKEAGERQADALNRIAEALEQMRP